MKRTDQTLLDQMQMSDVEILRRMELLGLEPNDLNELASHKVFIENSVDEIVDEFYEKQTEIDEISLLIGDADTLSRLRSAQRKYIIDLFSGHYDSAYVNNRLRIGMVHKRIGVEPKLYLSAVKTLKDLIASALAQVIVERKTLDSTLNTLDKLLYFDTTLVFDTYIDSLVGEIETAKKRTEEYAKSLEVKVADRTKQLEEQTKHDPLTNLYNPRVLREALKRELVLAERHRRKLALIYLDVDHFKKINDIQGHLKGDEVLKVLAQCLLGSIRETDLPCRCGGDEFCVILPECDIENAQKVSDKIIVSFAKHYPDYSLSIGVAETGTEEYMDEEALLQAADQRMYRAKETHGFKVCT